MAARPVLIDERTVEVGLRDVPADLLRRFRLGKREIGSEHGCQNAGDDDGRFFHGWFCYEIRTL